MNVVSLIKIRGHSQDFDLKTGALTDTSKKPVAGADNLKANFAYGSTNYPKGRLISKIASCSYTFTKASEG